MLIVLIIISFFFNLLAKQLVHLLSIYFVEKTILGSLVIAAAALN
jgi:hypothetical protein